MDDFITSLHSLLEYCNYGQLRDEIIRDQIVAGLHDSALSKKLQLESELTLEKVLTLALNRESIRKQQPIVRADTSSNVDAVGISSKHRSATKTQKSQKPSSASNFKCSRLVNQTTMAKNSALLRTIHVVRGHFQSVCRTKSVKAVVRETESNDDSTDDELDYD